MAQVHNSSLPYRISYEYDGKKRKLYPKKCEECKTMFWCPRHVKKRYCSTICSHAATKHQVELTCSLCKKKFFRTFNKSNAPKGKYRFCSRKCKDESQQTEIGLITYDHYKNGSYLYRKRAFRFHGKKCVECGYDRNEQMLDAHHADGNRKNGRKENLQVLCVWCHALKTRNVPFHLQGVLAHSEERLRGTQEVMGS